MHVHSCRFAYIKPIAFSLFWLPSPSSSLKLPIIMVKLSCVTAANSSSMIVYVQMDKWIKNGLDHKLNFLIHFSLNFPLPDRTKKQHMDFWYDRSKYDLMCFSFTWSHSLKVFYVTHLRRVFPWAVTFNSLGYIRFPSNIPAQKVKFYYKLYYRTIQVV